MPPPPAKLYIAGCHTGPSQPAVSCLLNPGSVIGWVWLSLVGFGYRSEGSLPRSWCYVAIRAVSTA
jgi:hypothetical protein